MSQQSMLRPVSFGIAAENLKLKSKELECIPVEWLPYLDGELTSDASEVVDSGVDGQGKAYSASVTTSNSIKATWLPWGSNRVTPPNIRRGERIMLYQFADKDEYYWKELGLDDGLRRLETIVYAISNTRDEDTKILTPANSYSIEWSTHTKQLTVRTNKSDGEPFAYVMQLNTKDGVFTLADDDSNYFEFDSAERKITAQNKDGSFITIDKRVIKAFAPDMIHMQSQHIEAHCDTMLIEASQTLTENVGQAIEVNTPNYTVNCDLWVGNVSSSTLWNTPLMTVTGNLTVNGFSLLALGFGAGPGGGSAGAATVSVPVTVNSPTTLNGNTDTTGTLTNNGVNVGSTHVHNETGTGGGTTTTPL